MCREVSLTYFDPNKETLIQVDTSLRSLGSALVQEGKVIAFASRALPETETCYANTEREVLAVVVAYKKFHSYIFGKKFTAEPDHKKPRNDSFEESNSCTPKTSANAAQDTRM